MGTSRRDMPLAANDSLEGEGGVDEGTSRRDMPLALADDALEREGGVDNVGDGECRKPSDQPRDAAQREECSNRMKRVFLLFIVVTGGRKGFAREHQNGFYET